MRQEAEIRNDIEMVESSLRASIDVDDNVKLIDRLGKLMRELQECINSK